VIDSGDGRLEVAGLAASPSSAEARPNAQLDTVKLVLELNRPLDGLIKVSSAPLRNALQHLGQ
jgi:hypothetical protein